MKVVGAAGVGTALGTFGSFFVQVFLGATTLTTGATAAGPSKRAFLVGFEVCCLEVEAFEEATVGNGALATGAFRLLPAAIEFDASVVAVKTPFDVFFLGVDGSKLVQAQ